MGVLPTIIEVDSKAALQLLNHISIYSIDLKKKRMVDLWRIWLSLPTSSTAGSLLLRIWFSPPYVEWSFFRAFPDELYPEMIMRNFVSFDSPTNTVATHVLYDLIWGSQPALVGVNSARYRRLRLSWFMNGLNNGYWWGISAALTLSSRNRCFNHLPKERLVVNPNFLLQ